MQQHQREQALHLRFVRHQLRQRATEPDRLRGEVAATAVALVEDQVDDGEHRGQPVGQQVSRRDAERDAGVADLALRANEPLRHRRLGDEERTRDLVGRQAAERAQRQGDLRVERERGMAAREDELEALVGEGGLVHRSPAHGFRCDRQQVRLRDERPVAADAVDRPVARGRRRARRPDSPGRRRAATARPRRRTPPARPPRRGRSRRGSRSAWRGRGPTRRGRPARRRRATLCPLSAPPPAAPRPRRRAAPRECARPARARVEVVGLEQVEAAERFLRLGERPVRRQGLAVLHAHRRRGRPRPAAPRRRRRQASRRWRSTRRRSPSARPRRGSPSRRRSSRSAVRTSRAPPSACCRSYDERAAAKSTRRVEERQRAGLVEHVVQVAALRALDAGRAAVAARAAAEQRGGVARPSPRTARSRAR